MFPVYVSSFDLIVNKLTWYVKHPMLFSDNCLSIIISYKARMLSHFIKSAAVLELQSWTRTGPELIKKGQREYHNSNKNCKVLL